jgi:hypothetical protein
MCKFPIIVLMYFILRYNINIEIDIFRISSCYIRVFLRYYLGKTFI